ncbi:MAG: hypothetical protein Q4G26_10510 [Paracoccus sp. (in: a-proteobacteria)]|nr:hypothetical protein [Paracoccus sp. (in: a-proteobacteria)]
MADSNRLLEKAAAALINGDSEAALRHLAALEARAKRRPELIDTEMQAGLARLAGMAQAAADGIADARALIEKASMNARNIKTYDDRGKPQPVTNARAALGRF